MTRVLEAALDAYREWAKLQSETSAALRRRADLECLLEDEDFARYEEILNHEEEAQYDRI